LRLNNKRWVFDTSKGYPVRKDYGDNYKKISIKKLIFSILSLLLTGSIGHPEKVKPITGFDLNRYVGKWYEIARLDHSFEQGLERVTASTIFVKMLELR